MADRVVYLAPSETSPAIASLAIKVSSLHTWMIAYLHNHGIAAADTAEAFIVSDACVFGPGTDPVSLLVMCWILEILNQID